MTGRINDKGVDAVYQALVKSTEGGKPAGGVVVKPSQWGPRTIKVENGKGKTNFEDLIAKIGSEIAKAKNEGLTLDKADQLQAILKHVKLLHEDNSTRGVQINVLHLHSDNAKTLQNLDLQLQMSRTLLVQNEKIEAELEKRATRPQTTPLTKDQLQGVKDQEKKYNELHVKYQGLRQDLTKEQRNKVYGPMVRFENALKTCLALQKEPATEAETNAAMKRLEEAYEPAARQLTKASDELTSKKEAAEQLKAQEKKTAEDLKAKEKALDHDKANAAIKALAPRMEAGFNACQARYQETPEEHQGSLMVLLSDVEDAFKKFEDLKLSDKSTFSEVQEVAKEFKASIDAFKAELNSAAPST